MSPTLNPGVTPTPENAAIQTGSMCSSHNTRCFCCPGKGTTGLCWQREEHHSDNVEGNEEVLAKISHYGCTYSSGHINYANFSCSLRENWFSHFPRSLHREEHSFLSRFLSLWPPFACRDISDSSNLCPNNQVLLIYFYIFMQISLFHLFVCLLQQGKYT